jgi:hypothetical protein
LPHCIDVENGCKTIFFLSYFSFTKKNYFSGFKSVRENTVIVALHMQWRCLPQPIIVLQGDFLDVFYVRYSTLLYLPPLRFHCVGGYGDRTQDCCDFGDRQRRIGNKEKRL